MLIFIYRLKVSLMIKIRHMFLAIIIFAIAHVVFILLLFVWLYCSLSSLFMCFLIITISSLPTLIIVYVDTFFFVFSHYNHFIPTLAYYSLC